MYGNGLPSIFRDGVNLCMVDTSGEWVGVGQQDSRIHEERNQPVIA